jgi:phage shock protein C
MKKKFRLNKRNAMLLGVCSGLADYTGWDVVLIRVGLVAVTILGAFPWTVIAYVATAWAAKPGEATSERVDAGLPRFEPASRAATSETTRRTAEVEQYVANPNEKLAREIEELR